MPASRCEGTSTRPPSYRGTVAACGWMWIAAFMLFVGCNAPPTPTPTPTPTPDPSDPQATARECVGCHTDQTLLRQIARVDPTPPPSTGEG